MTKYIPDYIIPYDPNDPDQVAVIERLLEQNRLTVFEVATQEVTNSVTGAVTRITDTYLVDAGGNIYQLVPEERLGMELGNLMAVDVDITTAISMFALTQEQADSYANKSLDVGYLASDAQGMCEAPQATLTFEAPLPMLEDTMLLLAPAGTLELFGQYLTEDAERNAAAYMSSLLDSGMVPYLSSDGTGSITSWPDVPLVPDALINEPLVDRTCTINNATPMPMT